jgi:hypothetical protein
MMSKRTPNGETKFGCTCSGDLPHDQQGLKQFFCDSCGWLWEARRRETHYVRSAAADTEPLQYQEKVCPGCITCEKTPLKPAKFLGAYLSSDD